MIVHFRAHPHVTVAPCGYSFAKNLRGLDYAETWSTAVIHPVTCPECRLKGPRNTVLRKRQWEDVKGGKTRF